MKKKVLIVRSVSFQQLDKNMTAIVKQFPVSEYLLDLLTHSHGIEQAGTYAAVSEILDYESRKNFSFFHVPRRLKRMTNHGIEETKESGPYEAIIVPVTNMTGAGFLNVLALTLRIPSHSIYICNLVSDIREISRKNIVVQMVRSFFFSIFSVLMTIPVAVVALPAVMVSLGLQREGKTYK